MNVDDQAPDECGEVSNETNQRRQSSPHELLGQLQGFVKRDPTFAVLMALGLGVGTGVVIGMLANRPRRCERMSRRCNAELGRQIARALTDAAPTLVEDYLKK